MLRSWKSHFRPFWADPDTLDLWLEKIKVIQLGEHDRLLMTFVPLLPHADDSSSLTITITTLMLFSWCWARCAQGKSCLSWAPFKTFFLKDTLFQKRNQQLQMFLERKKWKEKTTTFGVNLMRSQVLYQAAQGLKDVEVVLARAIVPSVSSCLQIFLWTFGAKSF